MAKGKKQNKQTNKKKKTSVFEKKVFLIKFFGFS